jgi:hypothetical protein
MQIAETLLSPRENIEKKSLRELMEGEYSQTNPFGLNRRRGVKNFLRNK